MNNTMTLSPICLLEIENKKYNTYSLFSIPPKNHLTPITLAIPLTTIATTQITITMTLITT